MEGCALPLRCTVRICCALYPLVCQVWDYGPHLTLLFLTLEEGPLM